MSGDPFDARSSKSQRDRFSFAPEATSLFVNFGSEFSPPVDDIMRAKNSLFGLVGHVVEWNKSSRGNR
jgi:hypothetical protein